MPATDDFKVIASSGAIDAGISAIEYWLTIADGPDEQDARERDFARELVIALRNAEPVT